MHMLAGSMNQHALPTLLYIFCNNNVSNFARLNFINIHIPSGLSVKYNENSLGGF